MTKRIKGDFWKKKKKKGADITVKNGIIKTKETH